MTGRYKIKTVAERTGFSPTLLRAWERRYDFLLPERQDSGHRLYTDEDLRVLRSVKLLLDRGQSIGEVAVMGRDALLRMTIPPGSVDGLGDRSSRSEEVSSITIYPEQEPLVAAVKALDTERARAIIAEFQSRHPGPETLTKFVLAVGEEVGRMWAEGELSVASEHLLSALWKEQLHTMIASARPARGSGKTVVCAGFPDELHDLGLLFLQYELTRAGHQVVFLGTALPFEDLDATIRRLRPHAVCLSVTRVPVLQTHLPRFAEVVQRHPTTRFLVGGSGVEGQNSALRRIGAVPWDKQRGLGDIEESIVA